MLKSEEAASFQNSSYKTLKIQPELENTNKSEVAECMKLYI